MKGIVMTPSDFRDESFGSTARTGSLKPVEHVMRSDGGTARADNQAANSNSAAAERPAGGFLNESIDEIARLYVESPFSW